MKDIDFKKFLETKLVENLDIALSKKESLNESISNLDVLSETSDIMDALLINYFGFLGLFSMRLTGAFKKYEETEGSIEHHNEITFEDNHDVSFCVKRAHNLGLIDDPTSSKLLRILQGIKTKEIKDKKDLDTSAIRRLLDFINYFEHRPSANVYDIIFRFHESEYTLSKTTNLLFQLAKTDEYREMTNEFRKLAVDGQYSRLFKDEVA